MHIRNKVSPLLSFSVITELPPLLRKPKIPVAFSTSINKYRTREVSKDRQKREFGEMGVKLMHNLVFLLCCFLFSSGTFAKDLEDKAQSSSHSSFHLQISNLDELLNENQPMVKKAERNYFASPHRLLIPVSDPESLDTMPQLDVTNPVTTVPTINPTTPTTSTPTYSDSTPTYADPTPTTSPVTNPYTTPTTTPTNPVTSPYTSPTTTTPTTGTPSTSSGQSWCVASQSASQTALQVALDYTCGYGGADCSAIQQGGSCYNPDTVRDHASYAFNSYYQKNPVPTSCDFGGTATITNTDPSTSTCQFPSASTSSSTTSPPTPISQTPPTTSTNPSGPTVYGLSPPDYGGSISNSISKLPSFTPMILLLSLVYFKLYE